MGKSVLLKPSCFLWVVTLESSLSSEWLVTTPRDGVGGSQWETLDVAPSCRVLAEYLEQFGGNNWDSFTLWGRKGGQISVSI